MIVIIFMEHVYFCILLSGLFVKINLKKNIILQTSHDFFVAIFFQFFSFYFVRPIFKNDPIWSDNRSQFYQWLLALKVIFKISPPEAFLGKGLLKKYSKLTGEHPCRSVVSVKLLASNFIEITVWHGCSPVD